MNLASANEGEQIGEACRAVGKVLAELWARVEQSMCSLPLVALSTVQSVSSTSSRNIGYKIAAHGAKRLHVGYIWKS